MIGQHLKERPQGGKWMKFLRTALIGFICMIFLISSCAGTGSQSHSDEQVEPSKLLVVWTSGDRDVAMNMVFMYTYNAKKTHGGKTSDSSCGEHPRNCSLEIKNCSRRF